MKISTILQSVLAAAICAHVEGYSPTDTLLDGDSAQSGYLPNHNMDPAVVSGGSFGLIWRYQTPAPRNGLPEQFYAKPLVYTPTTYGGQVVLTFSEQNRIFVLDAVNGTLISSRDLADEGEGPFQVADLGNCNDISGTIGITGTPVIDPDTDTVYFWAKSYLQVGQRGWQNGAYRFHAVDALTLKERPGFPRDIQGATGDNDKTRWFTGGTVLQRASLNMVNGVIFAGFGGHCDQYNFTGWIVGMSKQGDYLTGYATSGGPDAPPQDSTWNGGGGGCGVWMSGMPIASDNDGRLFFATGNGYKKVVNQALPASGRVHLDTLSECMVNLAVRGNGSLVQQDYFQTYEYLALDAADRDLGSGGIALPDPAVFSGGGVSRLAITCGKNAKCYVTNADNLGGYKLGQGGGDAIIQTLTPPSGGSIFGNVGTYPLEGGYLYVTPIGSPTYVYSLGRDSYGRPAFTLVAQTDELSAGRVGVGPATITTFKGQAGTAILWLVDPDAGVRAYYAVPQNGKMIKINLPSVPQLSKFQRPAFGDGRYYTAGVNGNILGFGSPVALPLTCTSPVDYGSVSIGTTKSMLINCTANIPITNFRGLTSGKTIYQASLSALPNGPLKKGDSFSFAVAFNLTGYTLNSDSTSVPAVQPGVQSTSISILTTNGITGYSNEQPISVSGRSVSPNPFIAVSPLGVNFPALVIGSVAAEKGSENTFIISNVGQNDMTITGYGFTDGTLMPDDDDDEPATFTNVTMSDYPVVLDEDGHFTSADLPAVGSVIKGGESVTVHVAFNTDNVGDVYSILQIYSNGGSAYTVFTGSADTAPVARIERSTNEGGWQALPPCADPEVGCDYHIDLGTSPGFTQLGVTIRLSNTGGSDLLITKSKPLEGTILGATNPNTDFHEGLIIPPGETSVGSVVFSPGAATLNSDPIIYSGTWALNTNDLTFGVHVLNFTGTLEALQVGPMLAGTGTARFKYLGCYIDNSNGIRLLQKQVNNVNNTNGLCQQQGFAGDYPFAGTQYRTECWLGSMIPDIKYRVDEKLCTTYQCPGDTAQLCGGAGGYMSLYYDQTKYFPQNGTLDAKYKPASSKALVGAYQYHGCYGDSLASRSLSGKTVGAFDTMTLESCAASCAGYTFFGVEYASECYCGDTLASTAVKSPDTDCKMVCAGDKTELCGAGSRLSVYAINGTITSGTIAIASTVLVTATPSSVAAAGNPQAVGEYTFIECRTDAVAKRTLTGKNTQSATMTLEICAAFCKSFIYFGVEYQQECYCGNTLTAGSSTVTDGRCSMKCTGNPVQICGGSSGLSLYQLTSTISNSTNNNTTSPSATTRTGTTLTIASGSSQSQPAATASAAPCPGSNNTTYSAGNGRTYTLECYIDHFGGDLDMMYVDDYGACVEACAMNVQCLAFSWMAPGPQSPCYMKSSVGNSNPNAGQQQFSSYINCGGISKLPWPHCVNLFRFVSIYYFDQHYCLSYFGFSCCLLYSFIDPFRNVKLFEEFNACFPSVLYEFIIARITNCHEQFKLSSRFNKYSNPSNLLTSGHCQLLSKTCERHGLLGFSNQIGFRFQIGDSIF